MAEQYRLGEDNKWYLYNKYSGLYELMRVIRVCRFCGIKEVEVILHEHHIIPKCIGGSDRYRVLLCEKCHTITHNLIPKLLWSHVTGKDEARLTLIRFTENKTKYDHIIQKR